MISGSPPPPPRNNAKFTKYPNIRLGRISAEEEEMEDISRIAPAQKLQTEVREDFTISEKAPTWAFSWLKVTTSAFTFSVIVNSSSTFVRSS